MQDFNYVHSNCFEVTFELSCCKYPEPSKLADEWTLNKESILQFMEATHWGISGVVVDSQTKKPIYQVRHRSRFLKIIFVLELAKAEGKIVSLTKLRLRSGFACSGTEFFEEPASGASSFIDRHRSLGPMYRHWCTNDY
jgi:hypothetical protein